MESNDYPARLRRFSLAAVAVMCRYYPPRLRPPLAAISLQSEVAARRASNNGHTDPHLRDALSEVTQQSKRAAAIVRGLRNLVSKAESQRSPVQLNEVVQDVSRLIDVQVVNCRKRLINEIKAGWCPYLSNLAANSAMFAEVPSNSSFRRLHDTWEYTPWSKGN